MKKLNNNLELEITSLEQNPIKDFEEYTQRKKTSKTYTELLNKLASEHKEQKKKLKIR